MAEFDINKVITIKDYYIDNNCVKIGAKYLFAKRFKNLKEYVTTSETIFVSKLASIKEGYFILDSIDPAYFWPFVSAEYLYPIEEQPKKYRPFKGKEFLNVLGRRVIKKDSHLDPLCKEVSKITTVDIIDTENSVFIILSWFSAKEFLEKFEFYNDDGTTSPCGVLEEEA